MTNASAHLKKGAIEKEVLALIPARVALHYVILPLEIEKGVLRVLAPADLPRQSKDELKLLLNHEISFDFADAEQIRGAIALHYGIGAGTVEALTHNQERAETVFEGEKVDAADQQTATVQKLVNELIVDAMKQRASDIHIEPFEAQFRIRYRVDGLLAEAHVPQQIRVLAPSLISRVKIMANLDIGEKRLPQDGRIKIMHGNEAIDLRVSVLPSAYGEAIVIRILKSLELLELEELGFEQDALLWFQKIFRSPHGMILVTGPTGSGKTTTLYACLKELNSLERKIITIEDPIEYKLPGIIQMQTHSKIGFTFAKALRAILRHDPDCMMVGEIRDKETADMAVRSALTGHLVFSTLHTNDAVSAVTRLLEMGIEPHLIASALTGVVAQRLVRKSCPPCEKCGGSGTFGRTVIYEVMSVSENLRAAIAERRPASEMKKIAREDGLVFMSESGARKIAVGVTTTAEIERVMVL